MKRLAALLKKSEQPLHEVLVVGDRAMLDDRLALLYDEKGLRYLAGLAAQKKVHRQLLELTTEAELSRYPLDQHRGRYGHWGRPVSIFFEHQKQEVFHRGAGCTQWPNAFRPLSDPEPNSSGPCGKPSSRYRPKPMPDKPTIVPRNKCRPGLKRSVETPRLADL